MHFYYHNISWLICIFFFASVVGDKSGLLLNFKDIQAEAPTEAATRLSLLRTMHGVIHRFCFRCSEYGK